MYENMIKIRVCVDNNVINKPNINHKYSLVYIGGLSLTEAFGNEMTNEFHLYENGKLFGNLKKKPILNDKLNSQIDRLTFLGKIIKIGYFEVKKIVLWGKNKSYFSIHGTPILFENILQDKDTEQWQYNLDKYIKYGNWFKCVEKEKKELLTHREKQSRIEKDGWDCEKPIDKNNYPPDITYPPTKWNGVTLEISKRSKSGYKNIYYKKGKYYYKVNSSISNFYDSPVIAAYNFSLHKTEEKQKKTENIYSENIYLDCPYDEKDECKMLGGKWDSRKKKWYIPKGTDSKNFKKWLNKNMITDYSNPKPPKDFKTDSLVNSDILPMSINYYPWLYEINKLNTEKKNNIGKWMLFYDKNIMNEKWKLATILFRKNKIKDVVSMKCGTNYINQRSSDHNKSVIILYCNESQNENKIMSIGKLIIKLFNYNRIIYYKTDNQTRSGTFATGQLKNYLYKLNPN